jgi:putative two-component system response regulator
MAKILIVDDEPYVRRTLSRLLDRAGHQCDVARDAEEATLQLRSASFDLMLADVRMPGRSGLELASWAQQSYPDLAVLMLTGVEDPDVADVALERGAFGYMVKPWRATEVLINVSGALRRRQLELERRRERHELQSEVGDRTRELRQFVDDLQTAKEQVAHAHEETVQRLCRAAEFRDNETAQHIQRMSHFCALLGRRLGMPEQRCEALRLASLMHDVGKIGIPDAILLKPGRLEPYEFDTMKLHAEIGYRILSGSNVVLLDQAAVIAHTHHEKFDGSGYPRGLAGDEIPLDGRITAVADVFDALTSKRVYKDPMPVDVALEILQDQRGKHFDPQIVDLFIDSIDEVLAVRERYPDSDSEESFVAGYLSASGAWPAVKLDDPS